MSSLEKEEAEGKSSSHTSCDDDDGGDDGDLGGYDGTKLSHIMMIWAAK
jgi:hypothetical protein